MTPDRKFISQSSCKQGVFSEKRTTRPYTLFICPSYGI